MSVVYVYLIVSPHIYIIAEPKGEASNRGARVTMSLYVYKYIYPSQSVRDTSIAQESRRRLVH